MNLYYSNTHTFPEKECRLILEEVSRIIMG